MVACAHNKRVENVDSCVASFHVVCCCVCVVIYLLASACSLTASSAGSVQHVEQCASLVGINYRSF